MHTKETADAMANSLSLVFEKQHLVLKTTFYELLKYGIMYSTSRHYSNSSKVTMGVDTSVAVTVTVGRREECVCSNPTFFFVLLRFKDDVTFR